MRYVLSGDIAEQKSFLAHDCVSQCISTHLVYLHNANVGLPIAPIFHFMARPVIQRALAQADQTGNSVARIIEELASDKQPTLPIDITVTDELKQ